MTREESLEAALREVMEWVGGWDPAFVLDDAWPETEARVMAALEPRSSAGP